MVMPNDISNLSNYVEGFIFRFLFFILLLIYRFYSVEEVTSVTDNKRR